MSKSAKFAAVAIVAVAAAILIYAVITPQTSTDTDHMGMGTGQMSYSSSNVGLIAISTVMIVAAIMILALRQEYEPLPPTFAPPAQTSQATIESGGTEKAEARATVQACADETASKEYLILRLLVGDERVMFKAIMDSGGEALQKDLIVRTKMSNAKVSRLLDRLGQKGVVSKERYGSTNKIRLKTE